MDISGPKSEPGNVTPVNSSLVACLPQAWHNSDPQFITLEDWTQIPTNSQRYPQILNFAHKISMIHTNSLHFPLHMISADPFFMSLIYVRTPKPKFITLEDWTPIPIKSQSIAGFPFKDALISGPPLTKPKYADAPKSKFIHNTERSAHDMPLFNLDFLSESFALSPFFTIRWVRTWKESSPWEAS